jgi:hypothetical protein
MTPIEFWWLIDDIAVEPCMSLERFEELEKEYGYANND